MADDLTFDKAQKRLEEIVNEVNAEGISLDEALALYEEAVKLGLAACDMSEQDALLITETAEEEVPEEAPETTKDESAQ